MHGLGLLWLATPVLALSSIQQTASEASAEFEKHAKQHAKWVQQSEQNYEFGSAACAMQHEFPAEWKPRSVHELRPQDIDLVIGLGDSLTAGRATLATDFDTLDLEYRGYSFATGNDESLDSFASLHSSHPSSSKHLSLDIFASFKQQSAIPGASYGSNPARTNYSSSWGFDLAISGSVAADLLPQAKRLVSLLKSDSSLDYKDAWKFVNIFVGTNDLCRMCTNLTKFGVDAFQNSMNKSLTYLRSYVNIMLPVDVAMITETHKYSKFCAAFHNVSCPCVSALPSAEFEKLKSFFDASLNIFYADAYQTADFAVSVSTASALRKLPAAADGAGPNLGILAIDCFHFSRQMHDVVAKAVWRNVLQPIPNRTALDPTHYAAAQIACPTADFRRASERRSAFVGISPYLDEASDARLQHCPYLRTLGNSQFCGASFRTMIVRTSSTAEMPLLLVGGCLMLIVLAFVAVVVQQRKAIARRRKPELAPLLRSTIFSDEETIF